VKRLVTALPTFKGMRQLSVLPILADAKAELVQQYRVPEKPKKKRKRAKEKR
jgi:hypothetical protein